MVETIGGNSKMTISMVKESTPGPVGKYTMVIGLMENKTAKQYFQAQMVKQEKVYGKTVIL